MLHTLGKTKWEDIEIGEVFAWDGCWQIFCKLDNFIALILASDEDNFQYSVGENDGCIMDIELYKLPLSVQRLWRQDD